MSEPWFEMRAATPEELPAVLESWAGTYKRSRSSGCIQNHLFNEVTFASITGLLRRGAQVSVLTAREAPSVVLGWVCHEPDHRSATPIVHYLFVKDRFRERGYARLMLAELGIKKGDRFIYTHETSFARYWPRSVHNPGIARRKRL